jgi:N-glycosylase/DNA lyase
MKVYEKNGSVFLDGVTNFNIEQTFTCGQCFRFHKFDTNCFEGVAHNKYLQISQIDDVVVIHNCNINEFHTIWEIFFDLDCDYGHIADELSVDGTMEKAIKFGNGIRILRQQTFECLLSFIISQNNSSGFCIKHFESLLYFGKSQMKKKEYGNFAGELIQIERRELARVNEDINWFTKKFDYKNHDADWKDSKDAPLRATSKLWGYIDSDD